MGTAVGIVIGVVLLGLVVWQVSFTISMNRQRRDAGIPFPRWAVVAIAVTIGVGTALGLFVLPNLID